MVIALAMVGVIYAVVLRLYTTDWMRGWVSLFIALLLMSGVQLISLGIIGEYIGRIYGEVKQRPLYFVQQRLGFKKEIRNAKIKRFAASDANLVAIDTSLE